MSDHSSEKKCSFPGCDRKARAKGQCDRHCRLRCQGKELHPLKMKRGHGTPPRIIYDEIECPNKELEGPCHIFRGHKSQNGYGSVRLNGKMVPVHRYCWEVKFGPIPEGLVVDHRCRSRACCNPNHLRIVTCKINALENSVGISAINAAKTHCPRGHQFDDGSLKIYRYGPRRVCMVCDKIRNKRRAAEKKAARAKRKKELADKRFLSTGDS